MVIVFQHVPEHVLMELAEVAVAFAIMDTNLMNLVGTANLFVSRVVVLEDFVVLRECVPVKMGK